LLEQLEVLCHIEDRSLLLFAFEWTNPVRWRVCDCRLLRLL